MVKKEKEDVAVDFQNPSSSAHRSKVETDCDNQDGDERLLDATQDDNKNLYVSTEVTYENIIELVNINPHAKLLDDTTNTTIYGVYDTNFATVPIAASNFGFRFVYETFPTEDVDSVPPQDDPEHSDVVFVKEYSLEREEQKEEQKTKVRRRRRRKNYGEKRRNPIRKAQINKASVDLVEKLAIPASVFNARVKTKKNLKPSKDSSNGHLLLKCTRQSARTSGAIRRSPIPFTRSDFKIWPENGMHERPFYNETTKKIEKHDYFYSSLSSSCCASTAITTTASTLLHRSNSNENQETSLSFTGVAPKRFKRFDLTGKRENDNFASLTDNRIKMLVDYTKELKSVDLRNDDGGVSHRSLLREMLKDACILHRLATNNLNDEELVTKYFSMSI